MAPDADAVTAALLECWGVLCGTLEGAWSRTADGITTVVTGIGAPFFNGVWVTGSGEVSDAAIESALGAVAATGLPHTMQARPSAVEPASAVAARRGLIPEPPTPLMVAAPPPPRYPVSGLVIRELEPEEAGLHCELAADAFGAPAELFAALMPPAVLAAPEFRVYVGEVSGEPVVTAVGVVRRPWAGIFNVGTPAERRRRGYGLAITAHVAAEAAAEGADWAWLQSSPAGLGVYQRLGFEVLERWPVWVTGSGS